MFHNNTFFHIFRYQLPLPSPEDLAAAFSATRGLASNSIVKFQREHRVLHLGGRANAQAHSCMLPLEISRVTGFPKAIVKAYIPPVIVDVGPPALLDTLAILKALTKEEETSASAGGAGGAAAAASAVAAPADVKLLESGSTTTTASRERSATGSSSSSSSSSTATKTTSEETKKEEGGWQEGDEGHEEMHKLPVNLILDVLASEVAVNLSSPEGKPILAIAVRRVASHLYLQGDNA